MNWFLVALFWISILIGFFSLIHKYGLELFAVVYFVMYFLHLTEIMRMPTNTYAIPLGDIFSSLRFVIVGFLFGKYADKIREFNKCLSVTIIGIGLTSYDAIEFYYSRIELENPHLAEFASEWTVFIVIGVLLIAVIYPLPIKKSVEPFFNWMGLASSLFFFAQRIVIEAVRISWRRKVDTSGLASWKLTYVLVFICIICMSVLISWLYQCRQIKNIGKWLI